MQNIKVISGENNSRFPCCTSLLVDGGDLVAVIDPGAGVKALQAASEEKHVDLVINTHYHFDHINCNYLFSEAKLLLNPLEAACFSDLADVGNLLGIREYYGDKGVAAWIDNVKNPQTKQTPFSPSCRHEWWLSTRTKAGEYEYGQEWFIGKAKVIMVHTPGHTQGFCCPYFPDEGIVYTGDIDLTYFGPWYAGSDGDIDSFIWSAKRVARLDADHFITGHQEGIFSRSQFLRRIDRFINIIEERQQRLVKLLESGIALQDVPNHGLIYPPKYHVDPWIKMWESIAVRKHYEKLQHQ